MELYLASERIGNLTEPPQLGLLVSDCNKTINLRHTHYFDNPVHVTKNCRDLFPTLDVKHQYMTPGISYINESVHHIITETREAILQLSINIHQIISDQIPDIQEADLLAESSIFLFETQKKLTSAYRSKVYQPPSAANSLSQTRSSWPSHRTPARAQT